MRQELWDRRLSAIRQYENSGLSGRDVAKQIGLTLQTVRKHAKANGIVFSEPKAQTEAICLPKQRLALIQQLAADGKTREETAAAAGLTYQSVVKIGIKHNIAFRHGGLKDKADDRAEAMASMFVSGKTLAEVGAVFGVSRERVRQVIKKFYGMTAVDGGAQARSERQRDKAARLRDEKYLKTRGCTYAEYRSLMTIGRQIMEDGGSRDVTPIGAFASQRQNAKSRGIEWKISLWDWWTIWQKSGKWDQRGRNKGSYVMCRFADDGIYEPGNVYIATATHNATVQPNNPYRKDHPDHAEALAKIRHKLRGGGARGAGRKRKYSDLPVGVRPRGKKFTAQISISRKIKFLGTFETPELAHQAYLDAWAELDRRTAA